MKTKVAIIGPGNIGSDLMFKIINLSETLEVAALVGIDPTSDGLARAAALDIPITAEGVDGLMNLPNFDEIDVVFDATSAKAHLYNAGKLASKNKLLVDLTPAAIGPYTIPAVNLDASMAEGNVNMVTCGGQATIPMVYAVSSHFPVHYAEIVASISSKSAGPGTRANIDEFTETTSSAIEKVGGAGRGKAIIILNPADPPMIMRDTVQVVVDRLDDAQKQEVVDSIDGMAAEVAKYVPGYRLKQKVQFSDEGAELDILLPEDARSGAYTRIQIFLEVEGAAMYLPAYAGNLDIMTSAAMRTAEAMVAARQNAAESETQK